MSVFAPRIVIGYLDVTDAPFMVEFGFNLGSPTTLYEAIASLFLDGSFQSSTGSENRSIQIPIIVEWPDSGVGALFAEQLELEVAKAVNEITFYPGDGKGKPTVLETFEGQVTHDYDQKLEKQGLRRYLYTCPALPFARAKNAVQFTWTGPGLELDPLTSLTGWTTSPTPTVTTVESAPAFEMAATTTLSKTFTMNNYLWLRLGSETAVAAGTLHDIKVNGVAIDSDTVRFAGSQYFTVPVERWRGQTVPVEFQINGFALSKSYLREIWTVGYPNMGAVVSSGTAKPKGIGIVNVKGSARTPCVISFTAPAGGAFVYTAPDPNTSIRRGAGEVVFGKFTVSDAAGAEVTIDGNLTYFPAGDHQVTIGMTAGRPVEVYPDGMFPQQEMGTFTASGITSTFKYPYPADRRAAVSFFTTSGAKTLVTPNPNLPQGYRGDAVVHTSHYLHPERCGFGVFDTSGNPLTTTVTYYPRNKIFAAH